MFQQHFAKNNVFIFNTHEKSFKDFKLDTQNLLKHESFSPELSSNDGFRQSNEATLAHSLDEGWRRIAMSPLKPKVYDGAALTNRTDQYLSRGADQFLHYHKLNYLFEQNLNPCQYCFEKYIYFKNLQVTLKT